MLINDSLFKSCPAIGNIHATMGHWYYTAHTPYAENIIIAQNQIRRDQERLVTIIKAEVREDLCS